MGTKAGASSHLTGAIDDLGRLAAYGRDRQVKIAVYNCRWNSFINDHASWKLTLGELPEVGIKFAPSHSIYDDPPAGDELGDKGVDYTIEFMKKLVL